MTYSLFFYGNDGKFEAPIQTGVEDIEYLFRNPRVWRTRWNFDGDGWYTSLTHRFEGYSGLGGFLIIRDK